MTESPIQSSEFSAPYVRVRGRISRKGEVRLDYCLRTFRLPNVKTWSQKGAHGTVVVQQTEQYVAAAAGPHSDLVVRMDLLDERDTILDTGYALVDYVFQEANWGAFVQRLNFKPSAVAVKVSLGSRKLDQFPLVNHVPQFRLSISPDPFNPLIDGMCKLTWTSTDTPVRPYKYYVRYTSGNRRWYRPAVNLHDRGFELDLSDMPGGDKPKSQRGPPVDHNTATNHLSFPLTNFPKPTGRKPPPPWYMNSQDQSSCANPYQHRPSGTI